MVLNIAQSYLLTEVAPLANEIDFNPKALFTALLGLRNLGLLALRVPQEWGGEDVNEETFNEFQQLVARYSGALAFLQTQHQSAAGMLVQSNNSALQQEYLPRIAQGEILLGVGFSQIRRQGEPVTTAIPVAHGYQLDGVVPWVTGWGLFQEFIVAATLPDGGAVFGIVPFEEQASGGITFSPPAQLAEMTSTNTVSATLTKYILPEERVVFIKPAGWIQINDQNNILRATPLAIGCAIAGLDILAAAAKMKSLAVIEEAFAAFSLELQQCRSAISQATHLNFTQKLHLRAWAIDLAVRCASAAVTVSSGSANYIHHPAQRVYREALVFTVSGQTPAIMAATLKRLTHDSYSLPSGYPSKRITYSRVIHLSHAINPEIPQWFGDPPVKFETVAELNTDGYYLRQFSLGEHTATHINAPKSFYPDGVGIDQYPADALVVPAVVIDIHTSVAKDPDYTLAIADILAWEQQYEQIPAGYVVLLYTGWQAKWWDKTAFMNADESGSLHFPGFSNEATQFLLQRQIAGVGIDTHGVDAGQDATFATNRLVLSQRRIVLENLTNLDQLPVRGATLVIGILRLQAGSGSPVGVVALVP